MDNNKIKVTDMKKEINRCAFCESDDVATHEYRTANWVVECKQCGSTGPFQETRNDAINAWNNRPLERDLATLVRSLVHSLKKLKSKNAKESRHENH